MLDLQVVKKTPVEVSFDASSSSDSDGSIVSYSWNFGDGSTGTGKTVSNTYDSTGDYQVKLTVTDGRGLMDSESMTVSVKAISKSNQRPSAKFSCSPQEGSVNVRCDASNSNDPDGTVVEYNWWIVNDCGSETAEFPKSGEKIFFSSNLVFSCLPYTANVKLTVKDDDGATAAKSKSYPGITK